MVDVLAGVVDEVAGVSMTSSTSEQVTASSRNLMPGKRDDKSSDDSCGTILKVVDGWRMTGSAVGASKLEPRSCEETRSMKLRKLGMRSSSLLVVHCEL